MQAQNRKLLNEFTTLQRKFIVDNEGNYYEGTVTENRHFKTLQLVKNRRNETPSDWTSLSKRDIIGLINIEVE